jgi:DNA repair protein RecN (Recombination protein N)
VLDELVVRNLGVIEEARLEPGPGMVVVTGETGAGKTLLLGALRMLLGGETRPDMVGPFGDETLVACRFVAGDDELGLSRRVPRQGRSRAYVDGAAASAAALVEQAGDRVEIIGQHDQISLTRPGEARALLDASLDPGGRSAAAAFRVAWDDRARIQAEIELVGGDRRVLERELDLLGHQVAEIRAAGFGAGDDTRLEALAARLRHADALRGHLAAGREGIERARDALGSVVGELSRAARLDGGLEGPAGLAAGVESQIEELTLAVARYLEELDVDPSEVEDTERRVALLADLRRKYGADLDEVLAYAEKSESRRAELSDLLGRADRLQGELGTAEAVLASAAAALTEARARAAGALEGRACAHLQELGLASPVVRFRISPRAPAASGADDVAIEFASDARLEPGDVAKVASGGELSRVVLALRLATGASRSTTLAFDEVDAGVGGATALEMGRKLAALAEGRQVLCVTHLPQVAAFGDRHYVVERDGVRATVREVTGSERVAELARMLAGLPDSERGRQAAAELLELARG